MVKVDACMLIIVLLNKYKKLTGKHYTILMMSWAGWIFDFYDLTLYTFLLIPLGKELHLNSMELGLILGYSLVATAVGGVFFGALADKIGRKKVLQLTIIIFSIGTFLSGLSVGLWDLLIYRTITGFGVGGEWATGQTYIAETFPAKKRGRFGAFMQTGAPIGVALASLVGGLLTPYIGWRNSFFISVAPALLVILIQKILPESDVWLLKKKAVAKKRVAKGLHVALETLKPLANAYKKQFTLSLVLATFAMSAYWFTYSWLPGYLNTERHLSLAKSTTWILITQLGGLLGYTTFGFFSDKFGRRPAFTFYCTIMAVSLLMITRFWGVIANQPQLILVFMFLVGFGTGMFGGFGPLIAELFPTEIRNTAMGASFNLARGIQFFTPILIAFIATYAGLGSGIMLGAVFAMLTGIWVWLFPETRGKELAEFAGH